MMGGSGMGLGGFGFGMGLGWIVPLLIVGVIVWAVIRYARGNEAEPVAAGPAPDRSLAILKERYAKGELDAQTYRRMRADLER